jgi:hypothetical protein
MLSGGTGRPRAIRDDVLEQSDQGLDLRRGELAAGRLPAQVPFEALALPFRFGDPVGDDGDVAVLLEQRRREGCVL